MIGLPKIEITFKQLAQTAIARSARGIVALIVKDKTDTTFEVKEYKLASEVEAAKYTIANAKYIKDVFEGGPSKVIVVRVEPDSKTASADAVKALGSRKYNWIGFAEGAVADQQALVAYVKEQETANKKNIKAVVYNTTSPDSMSVVNFVNEDVTYQDGKTVTGDKYVARLLGVFAGLPMTQSGTYKPLAELSIVKEPTDVEAAINAGKLVLINDEDTVRIGRAVNSLVTLGNGKSEDMKKIIVCETIHLIKEDIFSTFKNDYLGKYKNKYDNQVLFISAINTYFDILASEDILDPEYDNRCFVDVETQRKAWIESGKAEAQDWDDASVRIKTFRSNVFLGGSVKILDAMEDFTFTVNME
ncbi:phage tail sheath protein [Paenibacillus sp. ACRRX]|uniref:phage tail sheath C-terminal domain-containing protein n=1 Tax=Paenibacillus sp. ACRRX TaxID=2918206 RepID=UPI001EF651F1|nr:phage tail sheath C-terminal domain-containing protein [Paenibacillus sp. ACRRX]MCG7410577.1 phage tail sheath protein [Paenibacillus sp. ACRRX]